MRLLDPAVEEAAADLGAKPFSVFFRVTSGLVPGILAAAVLAFSLSFDDVVTAFFLAGSRVTTLPLLIFGLIRFNVSPEVNAIGSFVTALLIAITFLFIWMMDRSSSGKRSLTRTSATNEETSVNLKLSRGPVRTEFPREVRVIEHAWIPMRDGCRLAARIWLPVDAEGARCRRPRIHPLPQERRHDPLRRAQPPVFAGHGYASLRVDLRGTGDSDGLIHDEYLEQEHEDALDVLAWLEQQPWCTARSG